MRGPKVTYEKVAEVKGVAKKHSDLNYREIALLCETSYATVCRIMRGEYDDLAPAEKDEETVPDAERELAKQQRITNDLLHVIALSLCRLEGDANTEKRMLKQISDADPYWAAGKQKEEER